MTVGAPRRSFLLCVLAVLCLVLSGCGGTADAVSVDASPLELAAAIAASQEELPPLKPLLWEEETFSPYLSNYYGLEQGLVTDGAICYADGLEASELAVLVLADPADAATVEETLLSYIDSRAGDFAGYVPDQAALAERGLVAINGTYAALLICPSPAAARDAFLAAFDPDWTPPEVETVFPAEEPLPAPPASVPASEAEPVPESAAPVPESPPETEAGPSSETPPAAPAPVPTDDPYDAAGVLAAWRSGDPSGLSAKNRAVYDAAANAIAAVIVDGMTDYARELAIHDWMIAWGRYDPEVHSHAPDASPDPDNGNPYGFLVHQVGICRGYASTFQLFMDMLGIECITVPGSSGGDEHAWNMVRLDGEWYCVDVTWDDPSGGTPRHRYFNVTSQFLRDTNHQWDEAAVPEATATTHAWPAD